MANNNRARWVLTTILLGEAYLFYGFVAHFVAPYFPDGFDQTAYLMQSYWLFEEFWENGWTAIYNYVRASPATGFLLQAVAASTFSITGPTRIAALGLNFLAFAALQAVIFNSFSERGYRTVGLGAIGLLCTANSIFRGAGSMVDFRLDFVAFCLYGTVAVILQSSDGLLNRRRVLLAAVAAVLLAATRTITIVYMAGAVGCIWFFVLFRWLRIGGGIERRRLQNTTIFSAVLGTACAGIAALRWQTISAYYVSGHLSGQGVIQSTAFGITDFWSHLAYYPVNIWTHHFGANFHLGLFVAVACALSAFFWRWAKWNVGSILLPFIVVPLLVIVANPSKSPLVASIILGPLVVFLAMPICNVRSRTLIVLASAVLLYAGAANYLASYRLSIHSWTWLAYYQSLNKIYAKVGEVAATLGRNPVIFVDHESKIMSIGVLQVMAYEMSRQKLAVVDPLNDLGRDDSDLRFPFRRATPAEISALIFKSDIVVLSQDAVSVWDGYKSFAEHRDASRSAMAADFDLAHKSKPGTPEGVVEVYVRRIARP